MRLLRQISVDGNLWRHSSISSFPSKTSEIDRFGQNFIRHLSDTINLTIELLKSSSSISSSCDHLSIKQKSITDSNGSKKLKDGEQVTILKVLEELNFLIVYLIKLSSDKECQQQQRINNKEKSKSRFFRQYSAFVESSQFRRIRRSFSRQDSDNSSSSSSSTPSLSPANEISHSSVFLEDAHSLIPTCDFSLDEAGLKLIDNDIPGLLLDAILDIGFEEKKIVRIILNNLMILQVNKCHIVVDYFCKPSNSFLKRLVQSYEFGRSDVTLNCGTLIHQSFNNSHVNNSSSSNNNNIIIRLIISIFQDLFFVSLQNTNRSCLQLFNQTISIISSTTCNDHLLVIHLMWQWMCFLLSKQFSLITKNAQSPFSNRIQFLFIRHSSIY